MESVRITWRQFRQIAIYLDDDLIRHDGDIVITRMDDDESPARRVGVINVGSTADGTGGDFDVDGGCVGAQT